MTYLEHVTTYFISLVGKGVTLSSQDHALVRQWEADGLPAPAVCRALGIAVQRLGRTGRLSIADCAATMSRMLAHEPRQAPDEGRETQIRWTPRALLDGLSSIGRIAPSPSLKTVYRHLYRLVRSMSQDELSVEDIDRLDEQAVNLFLGTLLSGEQHRIRQAAMKKAGQLLGPSSSSHARDGLARSLIEDALREQFELVLPGEILIGGEQT